MRRSASPASPTWSRTSSTRPLGTPVTWARIRRWSRPRRVGWQLVVAPPPDQRVARGGTYQPEHDSQGRRLARPIGTEEPGDLARWSIEGQLLHRPHPAEMLGQPPD